MKWRFRIGLPWFRVERSNDDHMCCFRLYTYPHCFLDITRYKFDYKDGLPNLKKFHKETELIAEKKGKLMNDELMELVVKSQDRKHSAADEVSRKLADQEQAAKEKQEGKVNT